MRSWVPACWGRNLAPASDESGRLWVDKVTVPGQRWPECPRSSAALGLEGLGEGEAMRGQEWSSQARAGCVSLYPPRENDPSASHGTSRSRARRNLFKGAC